MNCIRYVAVCVALLLYASPVRAEDHCCSDDKLFRCHPVEKKQKTKIVYKTKWKTRWKTKVVEKKVPVEKKVYIPVAPDDPRLIKQRQRATQQTGNIHRSRTGNQKVIIKMPKQRDRIIKIIKYRTKVKRKRVIVRETAYNRLQFLVGSSRTAQDVIEKGCCEIHATTENEFDFGLQYLRDLGGFTGSISGTRNGNYYLGLGVNW